MSIAVITLSNVKESKLLGDAAERLASILKRGGCTDHPLKKHLDTVTRS